MAASQTSEHKKRGGFVRPPLVARPTERGGFYGGTMDLAERRNLQALEAIAEDTRLTQRMLSNRLGIALGLTNVYLKRLIRKGYVKCVNLQSNRLRYLLTPRGIVEKSRLTYEFMQYSLFLYGQVRQHLRTVLEPYTHSDLKRVALYGTGEEAELAYLSLTELGLEMVAVFDADGSTGSFLGQPVCDIANHADVSFDLLLVATLRQVEPIVDDLVRRGVPRERLITLRS
ncbi:MAG: winged helix-turn-helix transcriptional regulator [Acidobacteria bacterium]|nr:winged helix-turn-helix transcriptional regulator [Acidobacteriota bacterium]